MSWWGASLLFERRIADGQGSPLLEERIVLVEAQDALAAREWAANWANSETLTFRNVEDEQVEWRFIRLIDVKEILDDAPRMATEVFHRLLTEAEAEVITRAVDSPLD
jgi:hypothetical protein